MLDILNIIFIGANLLADIALYNSVDTAMPPLGTGVAEINFRHEGYTLFNLSVPPSEDGKCHYTGLAVPFDRTWDEVVNNGSVEMVLPPEPGKLVGHALIFNKKTCPGKEPEAMFRVATRFLPLMNKSSLQKGYLTHGIQLSNMPADQRPKWLPQVMEAVVKAAEIEPAAKAFLEYTKQAAATAIAPETKL
jgi:hypothetical protein